MTHAEPKRFPAATRVGLITLVALAVACESPPIEVAQPRPTPSPAPLVPAIRLVGTQFETGGRPAVTRGRNVTIDGVIRPTFSGSQRYFFYPACEPVADEPGMVECQVALPPKMARTPWAMIETTLPPPDEPGEKRTEAASARQTLSMMAPGLLGEAFGVQRVRLPAAAAKIFFARGMPDLSTRTVITPEMVLPGGATLRTFVGIEESAIVPDSMPVVFSVSLQRKGQNRPERLYRTILDPARQERHRGWVPVEVPLPDLGEEHFRLIFESLPRKKDDLRPSLPVWGDPTILRPEGDRRRPRHVVLISLDTLRARSMSVYGYGIETTPRFQQLLTEGTLFENAFTTFSNTLGSHMSMLTGLYPANHRVRATNLVLDHAVPTLAQRMRDAGYETAAFTENALLRADSGFQRGFAHYFENKDLRGGAGDAEGTFRRALDWASGQPDQPLFLFVHTYEVHAPYLPPEYTADGFEGNAEPDGPVPKDRQNYEREILHLDALLADFLAGLGRLAPPEDLLVVITADHGEEFFEHGAMRHLQMYDEVMQIPMFLRWPGRIPGDVRVTTPVSLVDVVPTVLDLVGAEPVSADGSSLTPLLEGAELARDVVFAQAARGGMNEHKSRYIARSETAKCMVRDDDEGDGWVRCFDLVADPGEKNPLSPEDHPELPALHAEAVAYRAQANREIEGEAEEKELVAEDEMDPQRREKLRMLGYIE